MSDICAGLQEMTRIARAAKKRQANQNESVIRAKLHEERHAAYRDKLGYGAMSAATIEGLDYCDILVITPEYQGKPDHYDPHKTPVCNGWPLNEMLQGLKGKARGIVEWAQDEGLTASIELRDRFDPLLGRRPTEYWLVVSWPEAKTAEKAA